MLKKEVEEFDKECKSLDSENRRLEHLVDIFGRRIKMIFECVIPLFSLNISKEKIDQVISVPLRKLAKKNIAVFWSDSVKTKLMQEALANKKREVFDIVFEA